MTSYAERVEEHRRLTILRFLAECPTYQSNESILTDAVNDVGIGSSRDQIRTSLGWLAEQGLIEITRPGGLNVAKALSRGLDAAAGRARVYGVQVPGPGA